MKETRNNITKYYLNNFDSISRYNLDITLTYQDIVDVRKYRTMGRELLCQTNNVDITLEKINSAHPCEIDGLVSNAVVDRLLPCTLEIISCDVLNININHESLRNKSIVSNIYKLNEILNWYEISLVIELVEYTKPSRASITQVNKLQSDGIQIAIDDFGTGFNTIENLIWLEQPKYIKFVYNKAFPLLLKEIELASKAFNLSSESFIVEYVDSLYKCESLKNFGLYLQQGYLFTNNFLSSQRKL